jgi:hypothetical protein
MATKKTPARPWTKNGKAKAAAPQKPGMTISSGREAMAKAAKDAAGARAKASAVASRAIRNAAPIIMPAPAGHPAAKLSPAAAGAAAAKSDDAAREALRKAGKKLPATLTGKAPAKAAAPAKAPAKPKALGVRAQIEADAAAGKLPAAPDWTKRTHYRAQYAALVEAVKARDIKALEKLELPTCIGQLTRYRDLAVIALKANTAKPKAAAAAIKRAPRRVGRRA